MNSLPSTLTLSEISVDSLLLNLLLVINLSPLGQLALQPQGDTHCSPCWIHQGYESCQHHVKCMRNIDTNQIIAKLSE